jgi:sigma-B regulation protein RsbU (phosphoserine phosphatase)
MQEERAGGRARRQMSNLKLSSLLDVTKAINNNISTSGLLEVYEEILKSKLNIGKLALYSFDNGWRCLLKYGVSDDHLTIDVERDLVKIKEIGVFDIDELNPAQSFEIVIPVYHKQNPLAYVLIGDIDDDKVEVSPVIRHLPFVQTLTNVIIVAIENKKLYKETIKRATIQKELELASQMQHMLFPEKLPKTKEIHFDAIYLPHQEVGGDYYDFIWLNDNEFAISMADVSGKGVAAALLMSNFQANLRALISYTDSLAELVTLLNEKVMFNAKGEKFITFFIAKYNIQTRVLTYVNCGHNPPILINGDTGFFLKVGTTGLGMFDELYSVREGIVPLAPNSMILMYTDGVVEVENESEEGFGSDRLLGVFQEAKNMNLEKINQHILFNIIDFKESKPYVDDIALFAGRLY